MLRILKGNKILTVDEKDKKFYLEIGYKIVDEKNKVIEGGAEKTVEVLRLEKEIEKLKAENETLEKKLKAAAEKHSKLEKGKGGGAPNPA
jgi:cell shape-determining protein MreC